MSKERLEQIEDDIKIIKENHLFHIEKDVVSIKESIVKMDDRIWTIMLLIIGATGFQVFAPMIIEQIIKTLN